MSFLLPEEYNYNYTGENGRELQFVCTNEALRELVAGFLASENIREIGRRELLTRYSLKYLMECLKKTEEKAVRYRQTGGMHFSAVFNSHEMLSFFEDIGRHNSADKVLGDCIMRNLHTSDGIFLASGRVSSEMVKKAAVLGVSVIASRAKPTLSAYEMARRANITLIGYLGRENAQIYCAPERLTDAGKEQNHG